MIEELLDKMQTAPRRVRLLPYWSEGELARRFHQFLLARLHCERVAAQVFWPRRPRLLATACWYFPIYSQTFVYQELAELVRRGFPLRFLYSRLNPRDYLPSQLSCLWQSKRKLILHPAVCQSDYAYYWKRMPDKIEMLVERLSRASGMPPQQLREHYHFRQAFTFTRMVEAYRPDYLHSYFFYEGTLFTLIASWLLDIPRGVSCYADHMLDDYPLKVVPLHLEQSSLIIATSERIKRELMTLAPQADPERIIVKPNAINTARFPQAARSDAKQGQPYRLVSVSRIEPKKGTIYLIDALRLLVDKKLAVQLHLLGGVDESAASSEYAKAVQARIKALKLEDIVHLEGRKSRPEIRRFLEASDLFVAPFIETESGDKDGIPTALLEAMSTGLAPVATDAGSIPEVIEDGCDGVLVPQRDPSALAAALESLLLEPVQRHRLGRAAAAKIRRRFDIEECERVFHDRLRALIQTQRR